MTDWGGAATGGRHESRRLIVNADDMGLATGVNEGIRIAATQGILTSASLMACGRAFEDAVGEARDLAALGVGVHLTVVGEAPVSEIARVRSLVNVAGRFPRTYRHLVLRWLGRRIILDEVEGEFRSQIERVLGAGIRPTHLDSHQHVHLLPGFLPRVANLAREYRIGAIRCPAERWAEMARVSGPRRAWEATLLRVLAGARRGWLRRRGIQTTDGVAGITCSGRLTPDRLRAILCRLPAGTTELVCHPGKVSPDMRGAYAHWAYRWEDELRALTDPGMRALVEELRIALVTFSDLGPAGPVCNDSPPEPADLWMRPRALEKESP